MSSSGMPSSFGARWRIAAVMLCTVSPVMVGAVAAPPQPMTPPSVSSRTSTFSALFTSSNAILSGFTIGRLTARGSMRLIFMSSR